MFEWGDCFLGGAERSVEVHGWMRAGRILPRIFQAVVVPLQGCISEKTTPGELPAWLRMALDPDPQRDQVGCSPRAITILPVRTVSMISNCENMLMAASIFEEFPEMRAIIEVGVRSTVLPPKCSMT